MSAETEKAATCVVCGREKWSAKRVRKLRGAHATDALSMLCSGNDLSNNKAVLECVRLGYERERAARVKAEQERDNAVKANTPIVREANDETGDFGDECGCGRNDVPHTLADCRGLQLERMTEAWAVQQRRATAADAEIDALRAECATLRRERDEARGLLEQALSTLESKKWRADVDAALAEEKARKP